MRKVYDLRAAVFAYSFKAKYRYALKSRFRVQLENIYLMGQIN